MKKLHSNQRGESSLGAIAIVIVVIAFVVVGSIGVWKAGWFIKAKDTDRQVQIDNSNKGTQTAWRDQVVRDIKDFNLLDPSSTAQRGAIRSEACDLISRLKDPYKTPNIIRFEQEECL